MVRGEFDAARPAILTYAHWHDHVGSIDEESLLFGHDAMPAGGGDSVRLAVMHAWVWVENPAGTFATDNWSLPFPRVGAQAPPDVTPDAARAAVRCNSGGAERRVVSRLPTASTRGRSWRIAVAYVK